MKAIKHVALEWSADDIQRHIDNLSSDNQVIVESRIGDQHKFLENVIEENKFQIMEFINDLIRNEINQL